MQFIQIGRRYITQDGQGSIYVQLFITHTYNKYYILYYVIIYYVILYYYESRLRFFELDNLPTEEIEIYIALLLSN